MTVDLLQLVPNVTQSCCFGEAAVWCSEMLNECTHEVTAIAQEGGVGGKGSTAVVGPVQGLTGALTDAQAASLAPTL